MNTSAPLAAPLAPLPLARLATVDLNLLVVFDALHAEGSVSRAATRLGLSQPAFSHALTRLRRIVGDPLFRSTGRGMSPTPRARAMAAPVRAALGQLQSALNGTTAPSSTGRVVTVAANQYARCVLLPAAINTLRRRAPHVRLSVMQPDAIQDAASQPDFTLMWSSIDRGTTAAPVILRDELVCVVRRMKRRQSGTRRLAAADFEGRERIEVTDSTDLPFVPSDPTSHVVSDMLSAMCVVSSTDAVARVPRLLAAKFGPALGLEIVKVSALASVTVALSMASAAHSPNSVDPAISAVAGSMVESAARLAKRIRN